MRGGGVVCIYYIPDLTFFWLGVVERGSEEEEEVEEEALQKLYGEHIIPKALELFVWVVAIKTLTYFSCFIFSSCVFFYAHVNLTNKERPTHLTSGRDFRWHSVFSFVSTLCD